MYMKYEIGTWNETRDKSGAPRLTQPFACSVGQVNETFANRVYRKGGVVWSEVSAIVSAVFLLRYPSLPFPKRRREKWNLTAARGHAYMNHWHTKTHRRDPCIQNNNNGVPHHGPKNQPLYIDIGIQRQDSHFGTVTCGRSI